MPKKHDKVGGKVIRVPSDDGFEVPHRIEGYVKAARRDETCFAAPATANLTDMSQNCTI